MISAAACAICRAPEANLPKPLYMKDLIFDFVFYCLGQGGHAGCREHRYVPWHILCLRLFLIGGYRIKGALRGQSESGDDSIVLVVTQYDFHPPIGRVEGSFRRQRVMAKRRFKLSDVQESALYGAYVQCKDGPTRTRYQAVRLYGGGYALEEVIDITGCGRSSLMDWCRTYRKYGIDGLVDQRNGGNHRKLSAEQIADLRDRFAVGARRRDLLEFGDGYQHGLVDAALDVHRVDAGRNGFQALTDDCLCQYGRRGRAVAGNV